MFSFFEEIATKTDIPLNIFNNSFKLINIGNRCVYIEGLKNIISFENDEISIKLTKGIVKISGNNIKIKNMNSNTMLVVGDIKSVEVS